MEFQRDNRLSADGHVGPATMQALRKPQQASQQIYATLTEMVSTLSLHLPATSRIQFNNECRYLLAPLRPIEIPIGGPSTRAFFAVPWQVWYLSTPQGQLFLALIVLLTLIYMALLASRNPKTRERGIRWKRETEMLQEQAGDKTPEDSARDALSKTKQAARDLIETKAEALERCKQNNDKPTPSCEKALNEIDRVKREIFEKLSKPSSFTSLIQGITRNMGELSRDILLAARLLRGIKRDSD
jgi:hypothetical protein